MVGRGSFHVCCSSVNTWLYTWRDWLSIKIAALFLNLLVNFEECFFHRILIFIKDNILAVLPTNILVILTKMTIFSKNFFFSLPVPILLGSTLQILKIGVLLGVLKFFHSLSGIVNTLLIIFLNRDLFKTWGRSVVSWHSISNFSQCKKESNYSYSNAKLLKSPCEIGFTNWTIFRGIEWMWTITARMLVLLCGILMVICSSNDCCNQNGCKWEETITKS